MSQSKPKQHTFSRFGFAWVTFALFAVSLVGHWILGWHAFVEEQAAHGQTVDTATYLIVLGRDTLENWQSEFLQLLWQVSGLALLYHIGSPQSKEGNDRLEEKVDLILRAVSNDGRSQIAALDHIYQRD